MPATAINGFLLNPQRFFFLGDSITEDGTYISHIRLYFQRYLAEYEPEFINAGLSSETASGLSEPSHPFPRPCVRDRIDAIAQELKPEDVVIFCYGMNDGIYHPFSEERFAAYRQGIEALISRLKQTGCRVIAMTPPPFDSASRPGCAGEAATEYGWMNAHREYDGVLAKYSDYVKTMPGTDGTIDIRTPLLAHIRSMREENPGCFYGDGVHPDVRGHWVIAATVMNALFNITLSKAPDFVLFPMMCPDYVLEQQRHGLMSAAWRKHIGLGPYRQEDAPSLASAGLKERELHSQIEDAISQSGVRERCEESLYRGFRRLDFYAAGREAILMLPDRMLDGNPWVWRTEFFEAFDDADMAMLKKGYCRAYIRLSDMYGNAEAIECMRVFYEMMKNRFGLSGKPVIVGLSRGGLYAANFASNYPERTGALYLDAPLIDIAQWPASQGCDAAAVRELAECAASYAFSQALSERMMTSPEDRFQRLAEYRITLLLVSGDSDRVVPYHKNGVVLQQFYEAAGMEVRVILKPGGDHHPHGLADVTPAVDFILENTMHHSS